MTFHEQDFDRQWQALAEPSSPAEPLRWEWENGRAECSLENVESLACSLQELKVYSDSLAGADAAQLQSRGQQLAQRLRYLTEPLQVLETDAETPAVQMRSLPPQREGKTSLYYELELRPGAICLQRYCKRPGQPRRSVGANLTKEVLLRLMRDVQSATENPA